MRHNLNQLIKEQLVNQFENVVKEEIRHHNIAIEKNDNLLKELKESFREFHKEHEKLKSTNEDLYNENLKNFIDTISKIHESFDNQRRFIRENAKKLDALIEDFKNQIGEYIKLESFEYQKFYVEEGFKSLKKHIEDKSKYHDGNLYKEKIEMTGLLDAAKELFIQSFDKLNNSMECLESKFEKYRIDSVGVLKEIQVYKKSMFIIEKKIENLYTLIERINKRISS